MLEIVLPAGTNEVTVADIPGLLALAIHPRQPPGRVVSYLAKQPAPDGGAYPLAPEDEAALTEIWAGLPVPKAGLPEAEWKHYADTFDASLERPNWTLVPVWRNEESSADMLRADAEEMHRRALRIALDQGAIISQNHARMPSEGYPSDIVSIDALRAYAAQFGVAVRVEEPQAQPKTGADLSIERSRTEPPEVLQELTGTNASPSDTSKLDYRTRIQAEAYELWIRLLASGANPTVHSICGGMAKWCADNDVRGPGKTNPRAGTIRNTVLGGRHWDPPKMSRQQAKEHVARLAQVARG